MATDVPTFRIRFPEFADDTEYPDARIQLFLDDAANCYMGTDENRWCGKYDYAQAYLAAHLLTVGTSAEAGDSSVKAGPVSSKTAGGVSVSRAVVAKDRSDLDDFYMGTTYGQQFLNIRNTCFVGVVVANCL
jgi:hypothetical protein